MADLGVRDLIGLMSDVEHAAGDRGLPADRPPQSEEADSEVIRARELSRGIARGMSLDVRRGEVVGIAGLVGSGRTEFLRMLAGADKPESGTLEWNGEVVRKFTVREALKHGIVLLPEDRRYQGGFQDLSVAANVSLPSLGTLSWRSTVLRLRAEAQVVRNVLTQLRVPVSRVKDPMRVLSGGNQQKVAIAKWLLTNPRVFLFDEPTAGIDVHAKESIRQELRRLAGAGAGVVVVSSDNEEFAELCDRVVVLHEGRVAGDLAGDAITPAAILRLSYGGVEEVPAEDAALG
jgi:ABC-type sugar transport system ATPase subunit